MDKLTLHDIVRLFYRDKKMQIFYFDDFKNWYVGNFGSFDVERGNEILDMMIPLGTDSYKLPFWA